jgi:hypothetical protein
MKWFRTYVIVTVGALVGMILGGSFGLGAGLLAPDLFAHLIPWSGVEPMAAAIVYGASAGVFLGGGLAVFALVIQTVTSWRRQA